MSSIIIVILLPFFLIAIILCFFFFLVSLFRKPGNNSQTKKESYDHDHHNKHNKDQYLEEYYQFYFHRRIDPISLDYYRNLSVKMVDDLSSYRQRVMDGYQKAQSAHLIVAGLVRNAESNIPHLRWLDSQFLSAFSSVQWVIVENNSRDDTRARLLEWSSSSYSPSSSSPFLPSLSEGDDAEGEEKKQEEEERDPSPVHILCPFDLHHGNHHECFLPSYRKEFGHDPSYERIRRLAHLRNFYLDYIQLHLIPKSSASTVLPSSDFFLMVLDCDLHGDVPLDGIMHSLSYMFEFPSISGIACNGLVPDPEPSKSLKMSSPRFSYYDTFAYVEEGEPIEWPSLRAQQRHHWTVRSKTSGRSASDLDRLRPVKSAFGGMALYRWEAIQRSGARYSHSAHPQRYSCEHSHFHGAVGGSMFVNPRMLYIIDNFVD